MRYQRLDKTAPTTDDSAVAAVWPTTAVETLVTAPPKEAEQAVEAFAATPAMADVPSGVANILVGAYAALMLVFFAFFARSTMALFVVTVCAFFATMFFGVPKIFLAIEAAPGRRPTLARFMRDGLATLTGQSSGRDALVQMVLVPVLVTLGITVIGIIARIYIP